MVIGDDTVSNDINSSEQGKDSFLLEQSISYTPENAHTVELKRHAIIDFILKNPNRTIYGIAKGVSMSYNLCHQAMKELVFARLVCVRQGFDTQNRICEVFFIPVELKK